MLIEDGSVALSVDEPVQFSRPSIDVLFESASAEHGERTIGVVLTGANADGAEGLGAIKRRGGYTIVQDPASAERPEMPEAARAIGPNAVVALEDVAQVLCVMGDARHGDVSRAPRERALDLPSVLLVDDRPENLLALEAVLASLPCRLVSVTSGQEALRRLLHDDFALILLDVQMPELDGFETAEYIKRRRKTRAIPIIFVTAISKERHHVYRGYETGAVDYVFKPYDPHLLRAKVQVFLDLYDATRQVRRNEELLRATFDWAPIGMARMDEDGVILQVNQALTQVLGVREGTLLGRTLESVTHADDAGSDRRQRADLLRGRVDSYEVEMRLLDDDGRGGPHAAELLVAREEDDTLRAPARAGAGRARAQARAEAFEELVREQAARAQAEAATERQRVIGEITDAALAPLALDDLLTELLARISKELGVDGAAVVLEEEGQGHVVVHAAGEAAAFVQEHGPHEHGSRRG
jgi:PAS domain S-box-containing protein